VIEFPAGEVRFPLIGSPPAWLILALCGAFYFTAFFSLRLHGISREQESASKRIPYSLTFGQRDTLATEYKARYPRSIVYQLTLRCAITLTALAAVFAGFRIWEATRGR
jgi:hypothetical protein